MVDTENLRTASAYINNQLLSRGLLRDGQTIDFAGHGKNEDASVTAGRIISVINDLILRRDRDAENRESLSTTMRSLRSENIKCINDISKLEDKNAEAQRKLEIATAAENAARTQLKSAESTVRGLKEQLARTKALVAQTRTSCATEVRRRDRQIDTLKKQLGEAGRSRGARANPAITTITITGNVDEEPPSPTKTGTMTVDEYSLRGESTVSLAKLSQNLSEENEAVLALMSEVMSQLREMSGWEDDRPENTQANPQQNLEDMSTELDSIMEHMRHILNNPSFVPIEEVVTREEEINRLKDGWVKMETRWKDAMVLIDSWRKRMAAGGSPIGEDELKLGFRLGSVRLTDSHIGDSTLAPLPEEPYEDDLYGNSDSESEDDGYPNEPNGMEAQLDEPQPEEELEEAAEPEQAEEEIPEVEEAEQEEPAIEEPVEEAADEAVDQASRESTPLPEPPQPSPLRKSSSAGNRGSKQATSATAPTAASTQRKRPEASSAVPVPTQRRQASDLHVPKRSLEQPSRRPTRIASRVESKSQIRPPTRVTSLEEALLSKPRREANTQKSRQVESQSEPPSTESTQPNSEEPVAEPEPKHETRRRVVPPQRTTGKPTPRKPFPRPAEPVAQQSPPTMSNIEAKLAASEANADRVRAKVLAARSRSTTVKPTEQVKDINTGNDAGVSESQPQVQISEAYEEPAENVENVDPQKVDPEPAPEDGHLKVQKRKRDIRISSKRTSRRRSTLSPMELETLISGTAQEP